jgi:hypothetical protein
MTATHRCDPILLGGPVTQARVLRMLLACMAKDGNERVSVVADAPPEAEMDKG